MPISMGLRRDLDQPLPVLPLYRLFDLHRPRIEIDLVPGQPRCLTNAQTGRHEEDPEGMEPIFPGDRKELGNLRGSRRIGLVACRPRRGDGGSRSGGNDHFFHCLAEGAAQDGLRLLHAPGRESGARELG